MSWSHDLWFFPTEEGKQILHIKGPVNVESGFRPFVNQRIGKAAAQENLPNWKYGAGWNGTANEVVMWVGSNGDRRQVKIGALEQRSKDWVAPDAVQWKPLQPRKQQGYHY